MLASCRTLSILQQQDSIVLDVNEVRLVDREAVQFLARREAEGVELDNCPPYIREWIEKERPQLK